jgi:hypothetical protein
MPYRMTRTLQGLAILNIAFAAALQGAVLRGVVVENQTGRPLSRTVVTAQPVPGTGGAAQSGRTNGFGAFEFGSLPPGAYIVSASRRGFAPIQYGQKQWKSSGAPVLVAEREATVLNIRLPRYGAITGTVVDENDVGMPDYEVMAYRNTRPPQLVSRTKSDDRGVYRIGGLEPGTYVVRTMGYQEDDGGYLPTFGKETASLDQARTEDVDLDRSYDLFDVRPLRGRLSMLTGQVIPATAPCQAVKVTLAGDMGRETIETCGGFRFGPLAPGKYEIYADGPGDNRTPPSGAYQMLSLERDDTSISVRMNPLRPSLFTFEGAGGQTAAEGGAYQLLARRKDLAGYGDVQVLKIAGGRTSLGSGRWELMMAPSPAAYVAGFSGPRMPRDNPARPDLWNEITVDTYAQVRFTLGGNPASVSGTLKGGSEIAGAPVFLEPYDAERRERLAGPRVVRADMHGRYEFTGVAPGSYRILSTYEYQMPDADSMTNASAQGVAVQQGQRLQMDLDLYVIR